jgi:hypothetical protein
MNTDLVILEELFPLSEADACAGLVLPVQQDWLGHGRQFALSAGDAVTAHQLVEARLMLAMGRMGLSPSLSRALALKAAPSVLWIALTDWPGTWVVEGPPGLARAYLDHLERLGDDPLQQMAGAATDGFFRYGIARDQDVEFVSTLSSEDLDDGPEIGAVLSLPAVARDLVRSTQRPLFTIIAPPSQGALA